MANLTLRLLLNCLPLAGRRKALNELLRLTAAAFGQECAGWRRASSHNERLRHFALFSRSQAEKAIKKGTELTVRKILYENARHLGQDIRARLPIRNRADVAATLHHLYRMLAIDMAVDPLGTVTVQRCFFEPCYSPEICRFISALDEGIVAGICGGRLVFSQRLTEG
ncbi:MAG: hypothetical protein IH584_04690, partial [Candidatus Aminicenantes bacterium]|nr:hypothetical protein [Candidatus Aminicenantes bacterium]